MPKGRPTKPGQGPPKPCKALGDPTALKPEALKPNGFRGGFRGGLGGLRGFGAVYGGRMGLGGLGWGGGFGGGLGV